MLTTLKNIANPFHRAWGYALPHLSLILICVGIYLLGVATGFEAGVRYDRAYFASHYQAPLIVPPAHAPLPRAGHPFAGPSSATINMHLLPAVTDQDGLGACQSEAGVYYQLSYLYRQLHRKGFPKFSSRYAYSVYSDLYSGGQDGGSDLDRIMQIVATRGVPKFSQFPYPPDQIDTLPSLDTPLSAGSTLTPNVLASRFIIPNHVDTIAEFPGAGPAVIDQIRSAINSGEPVNLGIPVFPTFDNAGAYGGHVLMPSPRMGNRGGHAITITGYDDTHTYAGITGWVRIRNSWTTYWGDHGDAWIPYEFVSQYGFTIKTVHLGAA